VTDGGMSTLGASDEPLAQVYDVALLDLDGVVYLGPEPVPHAAQALARARALGMRLAFVTNNAARTPQSVAKHLSELAIPAEPDEVVTSAQAAAHYLADRLPAGARVLVVGTVGLHDALTERGLIPVASADDGDVAAVVQGFSPTIDWANLAEGAVAIGRGVPWVATNLDPTVPSPRGPLPGNGSLVAALRHATGAQPVATGKPEPAMHRESVQRSHALRPIVVGDRLDTDVEGAMAAGCASLLVLTGVTRPADVIHAPPRQRPSYLGRDLRALLHPHPGIALHGDVVTCCGWTATRTGEQIVLSRNHATQDTDDRAEREHAGKDEDIDALRALCGAAWRLPRSDSDPRADQATGSAVVIRAGDADGREVLARLGLTPADDGIRREEPNPENIERRGG
jgi:glycerol 3-phosphatase-2